MPSSSEDVATSDRRCPALSASSISRPLGSRQRAVVSAGQRLARELVQGRREPLGNPPAVDEDERGAVLAHQVHEPWVDGGPDRAPDRPLRGGPRGKLDGLADARHVLHRDLDAQLQGPAGARVHDGHGPPHRRERRSGELVPQLLLGRLAHRDGAPRRLRVEARRPGRRG